MKPVALIAANFLRQHRWPVLLLFPWILFTAVAVGDFGKSRPLPVDVAFFMQQQAIVICLFSAFLAADAIHGERKSRRILLLLSKAVSRAEYLLAVLLATWTAAISYALASGFCGVWLSARAMLANDIVWPFFVLVISGALIFASVAMFFATFLNPYLAMGCTFALFTAPTMWHAYRHPWSMWLPGYPHLVQFFIFSFRAGWSPQWTSIAAAMIESAVFWSLAVAVFNRRDIAVPVE